MKRSTLRLAAQALALVLVVGATAPSLAEKRFCKVINALDLPGKTKIKDTVGVITMAMTGLKAFMAIYFGVDQRRAALAENAEHNAQVANTLTPLGELFNWVKWVLKSFVPYNKNLAKALLGPDKIVQKPHVGSDGRVIQVQSRIPNRWREMSTGPESFLRKKGGYFKTGFASVYKWFEYVYMGWLGLATSVEVLQLSALGACKNVEVYCTRKNCSARLMDKVLQRLAAESASRRRELSPCASANGLDALWNKHEKILSKIAGDAGKLGAFLRKMASPLNAVQKLLKGVEPVAKAVDKILKGLDVVMKPVSAGVAKIGKLLDKKVCVMRGKCFRISEIPKMIKKFSKKLMKPVMKQVDKLFNPIINKVLKKLKIPGLGQLEKVAGKLGDGFGKITKVFDGIGQYVDLPLDRYAETLKAIAGDIAALK